MLQGIENSGERLIPGGSDIPTFYEHIYRYAFACKLLTGLEILDIASGEGYGTHALSRVAKCVMGVDIDAETVEHARAKYGHEYAVGSAEKIPIESARFDAAVSFETIEHIPKPEGFLKELSRILKPGGCLVISTPNKDVYHYDQEPNPFHLSELTLAEFTTILTPYFEIKEIYGQIYPDQTPLEQTLQPLGLKRMTHWLKNRFWPDFNADCSAEVDRMLERIPLLSRPLDGFWNPYALRKIDYLNDQKPKYMIAVALKK
jgi:ubiquinone/menaquinone biosynthesis C-methylase UbiE